MSNGPNTDKVQKDRDGKRALITLAIALPLGAIAYVGAYFRFDAEVAVERGDLIQSPHVYGFIAALFVVVGVVLMMPLIFRLAESASKSD